MTADTPTPAPKPDPKKLMDFKDALPYLFYRWYPVAKRAKTLPLNVRDGFAGGVLSGLDYAVAFLIENGQEDLAAKLSLLPAEGK